MLKFTMEISTGNSEMSEGRDVAAKLRTIADMIADMDKGIGAGSIRDDNGNRVGSWLFESE